MVSARRRPAARPLSGMKTLKHYFKSIPPPIDPGDVQDAMDLDTAHPLETGVSITNDVVLGETIDLTVDNDVKDDTNPDSAVKNLSASDNVQDSNNAIVDLVWTCISHPLNHNRLTTVRLDIKDTVSELYSTAHVSIAPGLLEAAHSSTPPDISFFKSLPIDVHNDRRWAVYLIVLEKPNQPDSAPMLYIGTATHADYGVSSRLKTYRKHAKGINGPTTGLPKFVRAVLEKGYHITNIGLLAWCPSPRAGLVPVLRCLFLALEATFSFGFWAMYSRDKDYGIGILCPWSREDIPYLGLCSHNPLRESAKGNLKLSFEELEELAHAIKERDRICRKKSDAKRRQKAMAEDPEGRLNMERAVCKRYYQANTRKRLELNDDWRKRNPEKKKAAIKRSRDKIYNEEKHYCALCQQPCENKKVLEKHKESKRHRDRAREAAEGVTRKFQCECGFSTDNEHVLKRHLGRQVHFKKLAKAKLRSA
jgi:hypothetical protein